MVVLAAKFKGHFYATVVTGIIPLKEFKIAIISLHLRISMFSLNLSPVI